MKSTVKIVLALLSLAPWAGHRPVSAQSEAPAYLGVKTCAHCHGTAEWTRMSHYSIWSATDPHSRAYKVLENDLSERIAGWMGLPENQPQTWAKCIRCHTTPAPEGARGEHWTLEEGVSCEACHGAAENWFVPHLEWDASHAENVGLGMIDLKNLEVRARLCLGCHLGLDHEIVAAGHPDLSFELFHYSFWQPPHWDYEEASPLVYWAVGQAVALEESLKDLNQALVDPTTGGDLHVEAFDDETCYRCHHKLSLDRWRYVEAHYGVVKPLIETLFAGDLQEIDSNVTRLAELIEAPQPQSQIEVLRIAGETASMVQALVPRLSDSLTHRPFEKETLERLMKALSEPVDDPPIGKYPEMDIPHAWMIRAYNRSEQKYLALKSLGLHGVLGDTGQTTGALLRALEAGDRTHPSLQTIDELWGFVDSVYPQERRGFTPAKFNETLKKVSALTGVE